MNQDEARAKLRAFLSDLQAACAKHGTVIKCWDEMGIALGFEGSSDRGLHLVNYEVSATEVRDAEWRWEEDEQRIAGPRVDRRFVLTTAPDLPEGTPYIAKAWRQEPL